ncbi:MAG: hypothetical protein MUO38_05955 [Anaerolineales bacterium]|nr:hypothetical protein [Anaerolineales bacterium]
MSLPVPPTPLPGPLPNSAQRRWHRKGLSLAAALLGASGLALAGCLPFGIDAVEPSLTSPPPTASAALAFPTLIPSPTLTPGPTSTTAPDVHAGLGAYLYRDDFSTNAGWEVGPDARGGTTLIDGRLVISVSTPGAFRYVLGPVPEVDDFFLEVGIRTQLCSPRDEFGVMLRVSPAGDHYRFTLTCDGGARVSRILNGSMSGLVPITITGDAIPGAPADNRIGVWANGSRLRFYLNGLEVFTIHDASLETGGVGFIVRSGAAGQVTVAFDDLTIRALLPTPPPALTPFPASPTS